MEKRLFLIDGNSLINRAFYALPPLINASGEPTNAVYGLTMMLMRLQGEYSPEQMVVAFDVSGPTFRHEQFPEYKAHRKGMPDDLRPQLPIMKDVLDAMGIARLELAGYEADDLIGTVAKQGENAGFKVYIVTGDRDAFQLISPQTVVLFTRRGITDTDLIDENELKQTYGITPEQVKDLKGLMGDSSDNIPGVPGVGEKTALKLLQSYHSVDGVYENIQEIRGKLQERLLTNEEQARLSKELATIDCSAPVQVDLELQGELNASKTRALFQHLGFKTLLERLDKTVPREENGPESYDTSFRMIDKDSLEQFRAVLEASTQVFMNYSAQHKMLFFLIDKKAWALSRDTLITELEKLIELLRQKTVFTTRTKEIQHLLQTTSNPLPVSFDLELALYCLNPEKRWDFLNLASHFRQPPADFEPGDLRWEIVWLQLFAEIATQIETELKDEDLWRLFREIELPLAQVLAAMEARGILVDAAKLQEISHDLNETMEKLTAQIYEQANEEFNINSPKQLGVILFEKMGLPILKRTKTGPSTSAEVLEELKEHPIVNDVLEFRQVAKLKSTYTDALAELISLQTGRIHTTFNQTITATGRLSSTHPNLQNIPVRTSEGRRIRQAFVAPSDSYLLSADYSQIELRLLAHMSQDEALIRAFQSGRDIHAQTAAEVFGLAVEEVTPEHRSAAKAINFGIVYGISSFGLAKGINLTRAQAQAYIDYYFQRYPKVKAYLDGAVETGKEKGFVQTILGRRRYLPELKSRNYALRNFAARTAMNSPIQGSAADIIKIAMLNVTKALQRENSTARLLLQVHDELVLECPQQEVNEVARLVKKEMEGVLALAVPLIVEVYYGTNWRDVKPLELEDDY